MNGKGHAPDVRKGAMSDDLRVIRGDDVIELLPMTECIDLMAAALASLARDESIQPLRTVLRVPGTNGALYDMPAWSGDPGALAVKLITVFPDNHARGLESHHGVVVSFDVETGRPACIVDAGALTAIRTAAVSGLATRLLARDDARTLALIGSGVQARSHLEAMLAVRPIERVRVWSPTASHRERLAHEASARHGLAVEAVDDAHAAVRDADIVCTVSGAREPVVRGEWLAPGVHINAVGASTPDTRELDSETMRRARIWVDARASALAESGDLLIARAEGAIGDDAIAGELGEVVAGLAGGRANALETTVFISLGLAVEDAAAAHHVHRRAVERDAGVVVNLARRPS
jgi:ornithine cyclodeaminase